MSTMPMNRGRFGQPVNEQGILMQDISQQRKLAEQLRKQGADELQGQMVSGHYVAPSWTQQLARVLNTYAGTEINSQADKKEQDYNTQKSKKFADILAGNKPQQIEGQPTVTSTMPAYTPEQQDQFGSPLPNVQREPVVTSTPTMTQESPEAMQARQQQAVLQYMQQYGNTPEAQYMLAQIGKQDDRAYAKGEKLEDRAYADTREEKLYNRGRTDKLSDIDAERKYQDIVRADTQGFQVSQQDRQFAQQYKLQSQSQGFTAGENQKNRDNDILQTKTKLAAENGSPKLQEGERKAATLLSRLRNSQSQLNSAIKTAPDAAKPELGAQSIRALTFGQGEALANYATSDERQQVESAQLDMLDAALTLGTGAAYTKEQLEGYRKSYFPQLGDSAKAVKDKQDRLNSIVKAAEIAAGRGAELVPQAPSDNIRTVDW
jgi:hypothetical protein